uniref:Uncharacterized protein n=1 Tax=Pseudomonas aeruginosa TaxID=287 RepID=B3G2I7_PSEAI|nr:hypothetical protein PACL_0461 [Pseudomonas aeruginosa]
MPPDESVKLMRTWRFENADIPVDFLAPTDQLAGWLGHVLLTGEDAAAPHRLEELVPHACIRTVM